MDKNNMIDLLEKIEQTGLSDLKTELDEEMNKPSEERDLIKIRDLIDSISEIEGDDSDGAFRRQKAQIKERVKADRSIRITRRRKQLAALAACAVVLFGLNQASLNACGETIFSRVYHFTKGGISIMVEENNSSTGIETTTDAIEIIELPTSSDDPYGIIGVCKEHGFAPMTPTYIPNDFKLINIDANSIHLSFKYSNGISDIFFNYNSSPQGVVGIAADSNEVEEITVNTCTFATVKEDNQFKAMALHENIFYSFFTYNVSYEEAYHILNSYM